MKREIDVIIVKRLSKDTLTCELITIEDKLEVYYELIGCRTIDIVGRYFSNKHFDIVCDDEGLLKANEGGELPSSWWQDTTGQYTPSYEGLFGTLILTHHNNEGDLTSVDPLDLLAIQQCYKVIPTKKQGEEIGLLFHEIERR